MSNGYRAMQLLSCIAVFLLSSCKQSIPIASMNTSMEEEPRIIAHRGANEWFNESTIPAYEIAAETGVESLEIDLRMTKDGHLVAMHDATIDRTTTGKGEVSDYTLKELKSFSTIEKRRGQIQTEDIPTLQEILETFQDTQKYYLETRLVEGKLAMEEKLIALLEEYKLIDKDLITIQSFSESSLEKIKELSPNVELALLFKRGSFSLRKARAVDYPIIGIESTDVTRKIVDKIHQQGKEVHVFFVDKKTQKKEQVRVRRYGVDGYFTDYIHYTKDILGI